MPMNPNPTAGELCVVAGKRGVSAHRKYATPHCVAIDQRRSLMLNDRPEEVMAALHACDCALLIGQSWDHTVPPRLPGALVEKPVVLRPDVRWWASLQKRSW